jgi:hypothetical protein
MESNRKLCLKQQTELRRVLTSGKQHEESMEMFFNQHAMLHSALVVKDEPVAAPAWSFEDEVLDDMVEEGMRLIPRSREHSVAWCIWHIARIEDVAMNILVAGESQILNEDDWLNRMAITIRHTGNAMDRGDVVELSDKINIEALRQYRVAVGRRTREIVRTHTPAMLKKKVEPSRIQRVMDEGALVEAARGIVDYWSRRDIAGLLLMPATRHNLVHLNEALDLKNRRQ